MSDKPNLSVRGRDEPIPLDEGVERSSARRVAQQRIARLLLWGAIVFLGIIVLRGFLAALGWAVILTIATWPLYERFLGLFDEKRRAAAAPFLFTLLIALIFVGPLAVAAVATGRDLNGVVSWIVEAEHNGIAPPDWLGGLPFVGEQARNWWMAHLAAPGAATEIIGFADKGSLARITQALGALIGHLFVFLGVTVLTLYFLFRDGISLGRGFRTLSNKVFGKPGEGLADLMVSAVRSTADGLVLVGLGEGAALAAAYTLLGVPHPALLGAVTGLLAMIPFGAPVFFTLASLLLLASGSMIKALVLFAFGWVVVLVADYVVRPALIGGAAKLPFLWVLLGIFGGLAAFGVLGLFLGPAIMAALITLWREGSDPRRSRAGLPLI